MPENITAIVARNELWSGRAASEPYEAGWAREAIFFIRALKEVKGAQPTLRVEISADGIYWAPEGTERPMPAGKDDVTALRVRHFGNWLRVAADFPPGAEATVLVAIHLKA